MVGLIIGGAIALITAAMAARKGYNFFIWFFAGGLIGLCVLSCLPFANEADAPEKDQAMRRTGNLIGGGLAVASLALGFLLIAAQT